MGGNAECQINKWPEGECCCNCRHRMKLVDSTPPYKQHGWVCLGMRELCLCEGDLISWGPNDSIGYDNPSDEVNTTDEHGICELWMEKK